MLKISRLADYATVIMAHLAQSPDKLCQAKAIAQATHVSEPTATKLLKKLTFAGLLRSELGVQGGYALKRAAPSISLVQILESIDGPLALTECSSEDNECALEPYCGVSEHWRLIHQKVHQALDGITLELLTKSHQSHQPTRTAQPAKMAAVRDIQERAL